MQTDPVETHTIDDSHQHLRYDRPSSEDLQRARAGARASAAQAILAAIEAPMSRLRAAVERALDAGQVTVPADLAPEDVAAALPRILQDAKARMAAAAEGLTVRRLAVGTAAEMAQRQYPLPPSSAEGVAAVRALADGVTSARASASALADRVVARGTEIERARRRLREAAGFCEWKARDLEDARRALAAVAQEVAGSFGR